MAARTVEKFNASGRDKVVTWCPSCHRHMGTFMTGVATAKFEVSHITEMLHARRHLLAPLLTHADRTQSGAAHAYRLSRSRRKSAGGRSACG